MDSMGSTDGNQSHDERSPDPWKWLLDRAMRKHQFLRVPYQDMQDLGSVAITLAALRVLPGADASYFGEHERWAKLAGVSVATLEDHIQILIEKSMVIGHGRERRRYKSYSLNSSPTEKKGKFGALPLCYMDRLRTYSERVLFSMIMTNGMLSIGAATRVVLAQHKSESEVDEHMSCVLSGQNFFRLTCEQFTHRSGCADRVFPTAKKALVASRLVVVYPDSQILPAGCGSWSECYE